MKTQLEMSIKRFLKTEDHQAVGRLLQEDFHIVKECMNKYNMRFSQAMFMILSIQGSYSELYYCEDDELVINLLAKELWN